MKSLKTILCFIVISAFVIALTACEGGNLKLSDAKQSASDYINKKYGISAKIVGADSNSYPDGFGFPVWEDSATIRMKKDDKFFNVLVELLSDGTCKCKDNYQQRDIEYAVKKLIDNEFGESKMALLGTNGLSDFYNFENYCRIKPLYIDTYFDGNNLSEVLKDQDIIIGVFYYNKDIDSLTEKPNFVDVILDSPNDRNSNSII